MESGILSVRGTCGQWSTEDSNSKVHHACFLHNFCWVCFVLPHRGSRTEERAFLRLLRGTVPWRHFHCGYAETDPLLWPQSAHPMCPDLHSGPACLPFACWLWGEDLTGLGNKHTHTHIHTFTYCRLLVWLCPFIHIGSNLNVLYFLRLSTHLIFLLKLH